MKKKLGIKHCIPGWRRDEVMQARVLNRVITLWKDGYTYEPDPRHGEHIVQELFDREGDVRDNLRAVQGRTGYRALTVRANYLALDRAGIGFPTKMAAEKMSSPQSADWEHLIKIGNIIRRLEWLRSLLSLITLRKLLSLLIRTGPHIQVRGGPLPVALCMLGRT